MLCRVAALGFAALVVVWPVRFGIELNTVADTVFSADAISIAPDQASARVQVQTQVQQTPVEPQGKTAGAAEDQPKAQSEAEAEPQNDISAEKPDRAPANAPAKLAALDPAEPTVVSQPAGEPFGLAVVPVAAGNVLTKWSGVEADIRAENKVLARCRQNIEACPAPARDFLAIVDQGRKLTGRARIGVINRAINLAIEPMSDMAQWGVPDRWSAPLETLTTHRGDCEDYAIAKYVALMQAGIPATDVKLIIVRNTEADEDHAVVAVYADGGWIMLDNRWLTMIEDNNMPKAVPLFVLDGGGVRQFTPAALAGARRQSTPASLGG